MPARRRLVTAKALAALVNCILFVLISWGVSLHEVLQVRRLDHRGMRGGVVYNRRDLYI